MRSLVRSLLLLGVSFTSLANVIAQGVVAPPAALPSGAPRPEEAVVLSPFEVSTSKDVGFVAASSLAGGRPWMELTQALAELNRRLPQL